LVGLNRDAYLPDLAMSVNNLAIDLAEAGCRQEALEAAQEAAPTITANWMIATPAYSRVPVRKIRAYSRSWRVTTLLSGR
jgi:hypothetical protein